MKNVILCMALLPACGIAPAETVYRCGPDGRTYSQSPCPDGRAVDVSDARSNAQQREAAMVVTQQVALAEAMERERHRREAIKSAGAVRLSAAPAPQTSASSAVKSGKKKSRHHAKTEDLPIVALAPKPSKPAKPKN